MPRTISKIDFEFLRQRAEKIVEGPESSTVFANPGDLPSALEELRIHGAELELQNEELQRERAHSEGLQQRYFRHFDLAPVGMIRLDAHGIVLEANILGAAMLGIERLRLASEKVAFAAHIDHESQAIFHTHLQSALSMVAPIAARKLETCELTLRGDRGPGKFVRMQTVVSIGVDRARDLLVTLTDLTEHQELEGGLARQREVAEAATRAKDLFFAMLSHELRTPLTPALMLVEELGRSAKLSRDERAALETIRRNLKLEVLLIDDLLDLTRISRGKLALDRQVTDAHLCVTRALENIPALNEKHLEVEVDLAATRCMVDADAGRLHQIASNLIRNAVKFTSSGGRIAIRSFNNSPEQLTIEFSDSGIGIEPTAIAEIFNPFAQATPSIQGRFGGLGLGLAISRALVEAHGGILTASSPGLGQGSTFHLELPALETGAQADPPPPAPAPRSRHRIKLRLLLVENHDDTRATLQRLLVRRGYQVRTAGDSASALALCAANDFDLLISDIGLPDRSGLDLMRDISREYEIPGVAISGFGMDTDIAKSEAAGFSEHLTKPIDFERLDAMLQGLAAAQQ